MRLIVRRKSRAYRTANGPKRCYSTRRSSATFKREVAAGSPGPACRVLEAHHDQTLSISVVTVGEFAEGFEDEENLTLRECLSGFEVLPVDRAVALVYARLSRQMRASRCRVGDNDLWIAATAVAHDLTLVTRDSRHMARIAGLDILTH